MNVSELNKSISAHGLWKAMLRSAIVGNKLDNTPQQIADEHLCTFGKVLDTVDISAQNTDFFFKVRELHIRFHKAAGRVALLAQSNPEEAAALLAVGSEFATLSTELLDAMTAWKNSLDV